MISDEEFARLQAQHIPTTGMQVASGVTCICGYWNGIEEPGKNRPVGLHGLTWHRAQIIGTFVRAQQVEAKRLLEYALHLRMYGERAPGGNETWRQFDQDNEVFLRSLDASPVPEVEPRAVSGYVLGERVRLHFEVRSLKNRYGVITKLDHGRQRLHVTLQHIGTVSADPSDVSRLG